MRHLDEADESAAPEAGLAELWYGGTEMTIEDLRAFREQKGIPWSTPLHEVVRLMELEESEIPGEWGEVYDELRRMIDVVGVKTPAALQALDRLREILVIQSSTDSFLEARRMKKAVQRLENDAKAWTPSRGARTHRFEYHPPEEQPDPGEGIAVLWVHNVGHDESQHRTFLDAMED